MSAVAERVLAFLIAPAPPSVRSAAWSASSPGSGAIGPPRVPSAEAAEPQPVPVAGGAEAASRAPTGFVLPVQLVAAAAVDREAPAARSGRLTKRGRRQTARKTTDGRTARGLRRAPAIGPSPAIAIVGDGVPAALGMALAAALARRRRLAVAVTAIWGGEQQTATASGSPTRAAALLASDICAATELSAQAAGAGVMIGLPRDGDVQMAHRLVVALGGEDAAQVLVVSGPRPPALDGVLAAHDLLVAMVAADAPAALGEVASASLRTLAPEARVAVVARPTGGFPRVLRHRTVVRQILRVLDA